MNRIHQTSPTVTDEPATIRSRRWWQVLALLALLVGLGAGWFLRPLLLGPRPADIDFARDMSAHHEQAVEMALIMRDRSTDEQLRTMALDVVLTQRTQIGQMQGWLTLWNQPLAGPEPPMAGMGEMMGMATEADVDQLRTLPLPEAETLFLQLMIRHHQGGVQMAQQALDTTDQAAVARLARSIVNSQQSEIEYMSTLLAKRGAEPLPPLEHRPDAQHAQP